MNIGFQLRPAQTRFKLSALRRKSELLCRIDMWGFVSIMLALLFIFLPVTPHTPPSIPVDRPTAYHSIPMPGSLREDAMLVMLTRGGRVYFGNHQVSSEDLPNEIRDRIVAGVEKRIYLAVDARVKYGDVKAVLDRIRAAGVEKVSFLTADPYI